MGNQFAYSIPQYSYTGISLIDFKLHTRAMMLSNYYGVWCIIMVFVEYEEQVESEERQGEKQLEVELMRVRDEIREARKELKRFLTSRQQKWWRGVIEECKDVSVRISEVCKCLRRLGMRGRPVARSKPLSVFDFKEHFENAAKNRYEENPEVIGRAMKETMNLSNDRRTKETNEVLKEVPERGDKGG